jgi:uncharacterized membrane protein
MENQNKTSTGLTENVAGLLCYILGFITGIIFLVIEKENKFVRFHAMQSIITSGGLFVIQIALGMIPFMWRLSSLVGLAGLILAIFLMYKAYQGEKYKLPIIGDIAEQNS